MHFARLNRRSRRGKSGSVLILTQSIHSATKLNVAPVNYLVPATSLLWALKKSTVYDYVVWGHNRLILCQLFSNSLNSYYVETFISASKVRAGGFVRYSIGAMTSVSSTQEVPPTGHRGLDFTLLSTWALFSKFSKLIEFSISN